MRIVLDTNVLVSALLNRAGVPAEALRAAAGGSIVLMDDRIRSEYTKVLARPKFEIDPSLVRQILDDLDAVAENVDTAPLAALLPDETDRPFLECALSGGADCIVTGNKRHFPAGACHGIAVLSPAEFLETIKGG